MRATGGDRASESPPLVLYELGRMGSSAGTLDLMVACSASSGFQDWLAQADGSLVVSTYQAGKVAMIGWDGRQVCLLMREFDKPLGLASPVGDLLWLHATTYGFSPMLLRWLMSFSRRSLDVTTLFICHGQAITSVI